MFRFKTLFASLLLGGLVFSNFQPAWAQEAEPTQYPLLWKIETSPPSYLFGTIHIPDERVTNLNPKVRAALDQADAVYTEIPMDMASQMGMAQKAMLPGSQTIKDILPEELYQRLDKYFKSKGFPIQGVQKFKIWMLTFMLDLLDLLPQMTSGEALDAMLYRIAQEDDKEVGGVETLDEQVGIFESFTVEEQVRMLEKSLKRHETYEGKDESYIEELTKIYLSGDSTKLMNIMNRDLDQSDPIEKRLFKLLLTDRNVHMADRSAKLIKDNPDNSYFFAFGAAHFPGKQGVVELLRKKGYKVTRIGAPPVKAKEAASGS